VEAVTVTKSLHVVAKVSGDNSATHHTRRTSKIRKKRMGRVLTRATTIAEG
jgi:hypothetical protein